MGESEKILKREKLKSTRQRNSVLEILRQEKLPISAEEIFLRLKDLGISVSVSTVYRILDVLEGKCILVRTKLNDDSKAFYELNNPVHRHHLLCVKCRKLQPVEGCPLEEYEKRLEREHGYIINGHSLEIYGICSKCGCK